MKHKTEQDKVSLSQGKVKTYKRKLNQKETKLNRLKETKSNQDRKSKDKTK